MVDGIKNHTGILLTGSQENSLYRSGATSSIVPTVLPGNVLAAQADLTVDDYFSLLQVLKADVGQVNSDFIVIKLPCDDPSKRRVVLAYQDELKADEQPLA